MRRTLYLFMILMPSVLWAQDAQFSQFYAAPLYHNPAYTGGGYAPRVMFNYRNQWPSLNANFTTSIFTFDHFIEKANSGVGITILNDQQGSRYRNSEISGLYSYQAKIQEEKYLRFGLQATYGNRGFDPNGLVFGDQIQNFMQTGNNGITGDGIAINPNPIKIIDFSSGFLYYSPKVFLGGTVKHLTQPLISFTNSTDPNVKLPRTYLLHGGYNFNLGNSLGNTTSDNDIVLTPTFLYKKQGPFSQIDMGAYITYTPLTFGLFYRGVPFVNKVMKKFPNQDALSILLGYRMDNFSMGYSYDITMSGLGVGTGGSHEFSVSYLFNRAEKNKSPYQRQRKREISCPKF